MSKKKLSDKEINILEDERVESKLSENKPGLTVFLEKMKDY